jgi:hypothetical protein
MPGPPLQIEHLQFDGRDPEARVFSAEPYAFGGGDRSVRASGPRSDPHSVARAGSRRATDRARAAPGPERAGARARRALRIQLRVASGRVWRLAALQSSTTRHRGDRVVHTPPARCCGLAGAPRRLGPEPTAMRCERPAPAGTVQRRLAGAGVRRREPAWLPTSSFPRRLLHWRVGRWMARKRLGEWWSVARNPSRNRLRRNPRSPGRRRDRACGGRHCAGRRRSIPIPAAACNTTPVGADPSAATSRTAARAASPQWADLTPTDDSTGGSASACFGNWSRSRRQLQPPRPPRLASHRRPAAASAVLLGARSGATDGYTPAKTAWRR